jgi:hypothetical protein
MTKNALADPRQDPETNSLFPRLTIPQGCFSESPTIRWFSGKRARFGLFNCVKRPPLTGWVFSPQGVIESVSMRGTISRYYQGVD